MGFFFLDLLWAPVDLRFPRFFFPCSFVFISHSPPRPCPPRKRGGKPPEKKKREDLKWFKQQWDLASACAFSTS